MRVIGAGTIGDVSFRLTAVARMSARGAFCGVDDMARGGRYLAGLFKWLNVAFSRRDCPGGCFAV